MKPSGLNSIEYALRPLFWLGRVIGWVILVACAGPPLLFLWFQSSLHYEAAAISALQRTAPVIMLDLDLGHCSGDLPFDVTGFGVAERDPWITKFALLRDLPWAPRLPSGFTPNYPLDYSSVPLPRATRDPAKLQGDTWYPFGLGKLAPTKNWDSGYGTDYAFAKLTGNHLAYCGAVRAVAAIRLLLGCRAVGHPELALDTLRGAEGGAMTLGGALEKLQLTPEQVQQFTAAYRTTLPDLPVLKLGLQRFSPDLWDSDASVRALNKLSTEYTENMGWRIGFNPWGGGGGREHAPDNHNLYIVTLGSGSADFNAFDFLFYHLPSASSAVEEERAQLQVLTQEAGWKVAFKGDPELRAQVAPILAWTRSTLQQDYEFARQYGHLFYRGNYYN